MAETGLCPHHRAPWPRRAILNLNESERRAGRGRRCLVISSCTPPCCVGFGRRLLTICFRLRTECRLSRLRTRPAPDCSVKHELTAPSTRSTWEKPMWEPSYGQVSIGSGHR